MAERERIETLIILGAGGDLTSRLLLPGLASFLTSDEAQSLALIGSARFRSITTQTPDASTSVQPSPSKPTLGTAQVARRF